MTNGLLVTGTDTGVGKTVVAVALLRGLVAQRRRAVGMMPVCAGVFVCCGMQSDEDEVADDMSESPALVEEDASAEEEADALFLEIADSANAFLGAADEHAEEAEAEAEAETEAEEESEDEAEDEAEDEEESEGESEAEEEEEVSGSA